MTHTEKVRLMDELVRDLVTTFQDKVTAAPGKEGKERDEHIVIGAQVFNVAMMEVMRSVIVKGGILTEEALFELFKTYFKEMKKYSSVLSETSPTTAIKVPGNDTVN